MQTATWTALVCNDVVELVQKACTELQKIWDDIGLPQEVSASVETMSLDAGKCACKPVASNFCAHINTEIFLPRIDAGI